MSDLWENVRRESELLRAERECGVRELMAEDPAPVDCWENQTQQDRLEYEAWLDEVYAAEELERGMQEEDERRDDR